MQKGMGKVSFEERLKAIQGDIEKECGVRPVISIEFGDYKTKEEANSILEMFHGEYTDTQHFYVWPNCDMVFVTRYVGNILHLEDPFYSDIQVHVSYTEFDNEKEGDLD